MTLIPETDDQMDKGSLLCGKVLKVLGGDYLIRLGDGTNKLVITDDETHHNGQPREGEWVVCWIDENNYVSVLTRAVQVPKQ